MMKLLRDLRFALIWFFIKDGKFLDSQKEVIIRKLCSHRHYHGKSSSVRTFGEWRKDVVEKATECMICGFSTKPVFRERMKIELEKSEM